MQILIKKCSDSRLWYANRVGERATLIRKFADAYQVIDPDGYSNFVRHEDAEIVVEDRA